MRSVRSIPAPAPATVLDVLRLGQYRDYSCAMTLLQAGVDTSVIALWLGHAGVRSTDPYLHADITIKETSPRPYHPDDGQARPLPASRQDARVPREPVTMPSNPTPRPRRCEPTPAAVSA